MNKTSTVLLIGVTGQLGNLIAQSLSEKFVKSDKAF